MEVGFRTGGRRVALGLGLAAVFILTSCAAEPGPGAVEDDAATAVGTAESPSPAAPVEAPSETAMAGEPMAEAMSADEMAHAEASSAARVPNNGATIRILSPGDGATFPAGEPVPVRVAIDNFELSPGGNHWHIEVDGVEVAMVMGAADTATLRDLAPGVRRIEAVLANAQHQDLQDGFTIQLTIED